MTESITQLSASKFPPLLAEIPDPPKQLFMKGTLPKKETKLLCVVGSRKYSPYGKQACETLISGLRGHDIAIVSGLALGMDAIAHRAAFKVGLTTIAVPGSGLSEKVLYPRTHVPLARDILNKGGALLSEFPSDFKARPESFPQRNRVMAGMSHATLVIEAEERSGTLITSRLATEYNRDVLTVPTSIFSSHSEGPHMLLRLGATPIRKSEDILEALGIDPVDTLSPNSPKSDFGELGVDEQEVVNLLSKQPLPRDELITLLGIPVHKANVLLSAMEIKGLIVERMGELYLK